MSTEIGFQNMFTTIRKILLTAAAASAVAMGGAASSSAATVTGGGTFISTAGGSRMANTTVGATFHCASGLVGTVVNGTYSMFPATVASLLPTFSGCSTAGLPISASCATSSVAITGNPVLGVTPAVVSFDCTYTLPALSCVFRVAGSMPGSFTNPPPNGLLTIFPGGQSLKIVSASASCAPFARVNDVMSFGAPSGGGTGLANIVYSFGPSGPTIT